VFRVFSVKVKLFVSLLCVCAVAITVSGRTVNPTHSLNPHRFGRLEPPVKIGITDAVMVTTDCL